MVRRLIIIMSMALIYNRLNNIHMTRSLFQDLLYCERCIKLIHMILDVNDKFFYQGPVISQTNGQ